MIPSCLFSSQLEFENFAAELSPGCTYSSVAVYSDEDENQLGVSINTFKMEIPVETGATSPKYVLLMWYHRKSGVSTSILPITAKCTIGTGDPMS